MQIGRFSMTPDDFGKYQQFVKIVCTKYQCTAKQKEAQKRMLYILEKVSVLQERIN
jgi:hypothetical protein